MSEIIHLDNSKNIDKETKLNGICNIIFNCTNSIHKYHPKYGIPSFYLNEILDNYNEKDDLDTGISIVLYILMKEQFIALDEFPERLGFPPELLENAQSALYDDYEQLVLKDAPYKLLRIILQNDLTHDVEDGIIDLLEEMRNNFKLGIENNG